MNPSEVQLGTPLAKEHLQWNLDCAGLHGHIYPNSSCDAARILCTSACFTCLPSGEGSSFIHVQKFLRTRRQITAKLTWQLLEQSGLRLEDNVVSLTPAQPAVNQHKVHPRTRGAAPVHAGKLFSCTGHPGCFHLSDSGGSLAALRCYCTCCR